MNLVKLSVEIHCNQPNWAKVQPESFCPCYRLYLNNELIAERSWKYGDSYFINEEIYANLTVEETNKLILEPLIKIPGLADFYLTNFSSFEREHVILSNDDLHVSFKVR